MRISLKPEFQQFIEDRVKAGTFATPEDVIEAGLGRLREDDFGDFQPGELDQLIGTADQQLSRGEGHSLDEVRLHFLAKSSESDQPK